MWILYIYMHKNMDDIGIATHYMDDSVSKNNRLILYVWTLDTQFVKTFGLKFLIYFVSQFDFK